MKQIKTTRHTEVPILINSSYDLSKFKFSLKKNRFKICDVKSSEFEKYIESLHPGKLSLKAIREERVCDNKYAIIKDNCSDITIEDNENDIYNVFHLLLIIFPSDLSIYWIMKYKESEGNVQHSINKYFFPYNNDNPLTSSEEYLDEINDFINIAFERLNYINKQHKNLYVKVTIGNYINSFNQLTLIEYRYLALCIALESIISGNNELTYRISRSAAILCGRDKEECETIFNNVKKIYKLRSKIVHGEKFDRSNLNNYFIMLRNLVSRVIIELLIHNIEENRELDDRITAIGYGNRNNISENWKEYILNQEIYKSLNSKL